MLFTLLSSPRQQRFRNVWGSRRAPLDLEMSLIAEETPPRSISHINFDPEAPIALVVPFANIGDAREKHGEGESDQSFIKTLGARAQAQAAVGSDIEIDIHGQMLVGSEIVDNALTLFAVDHVGIETARALGLKCSNPSDRLPAQCVYIAVVRNFERNVLAALWKHDATP